MKVKAKVTVSYEVEIDTDSTERHDIEDEVRTYWEGIMSAGLEGEFYEETEIDIL